MIHGSVAVTRIWIFYSNQPEILVKKEASRKKRRVEITVEMESCYRWNWSEQITLTQRVHLKYSERNTSKNDNIFCLFAAVQRCHMGASWLTLSSSACSHLKHSRCDVCPLPSHILTCTKTCLQAFAAAQIPHQSLSLKRSNVSAVELLLVPGNSFCNSRYEPICLTLTLRCTVVCIMGDSCPDRGVVSSPGRLMTLHPRYVSVMVWCCCCFSRCQKGAEWVTANEQIDDHRSIGNRWGTGIAMHKHGWHTHTHTVPNNSSIKGTLSVTECTIHRRIETRPHTVI